MAYKNKQKLINALVMAVDSGYTNSEIISGYIGRLQLCDVKGTYSKGQAIINHDINDIQAVVKKDKITSCNQRLCPSCMISEHIKKIKDNTLLLRYTLLEGFTSELYQTRINNIRYKNYKVYTLTLTSKDPLIKDIKDFMNRMDKAFTNLTKCKYWRSNVVGYIKYWHIQASNKRCSNIKEMELHPHIHCIIMVKDSTFIERLITENWYKVGTNQGLILYRCKDTDTNKSEELIIGQKVNKVTRSIKSIDNIAKDLSKGVKWWSFRRNSSKTLSTKDLAYLMVYLIPALSNKRMIVYAGVFKDNYKDLKYKANKDKGFYKMLCLYYGMPITNYD